MPGGSRVDMTMFVSLLGSIVTGLILLLATHKLSTRSLENLGILFSISYYREEAWRQVICLVSRCLPATGQGFMNRGS